MLSLRKGVAHWNSQPTYFITAEYPYFRDDPACWESRLHALIEMGVQIISTYIPWRHHEISSGGDRRFDFDGVTLPSRNVLGFIAACQRLGLRVLLKPGPFCHAELNYGGLPDFVCPLNRTDIPPALDPSGQPILWFLGGAADPAGAPIPWPLPSAHAPVYQAEVARWLQAVGTEVLLPNVSPDGPLIAIQVGNEGIFSDAQHAVWAYDYSAPAITRFQMWLRERYHTVDRYNEAHATLVRAWDEIIPPCRYEPGGDLRGLLAYRDWAEFAGVALAELYQTYARWLNVPVPALANVNPPMADAWGIDAWLSRVQPEQWGGVGYGYTNWIGFAAADPAVLARYMLLTRRAAGPNLEENWGFTAFYGEAYASTSTCFQQTLVAIAGGSTGYNVYTAVGTDAWHDDLDRFMERPYPSHAPITVTGELTPKARVLAQLNAFFSEYGGEFVTCAGQTGAAFAFYQPYAYLGAWLDADTIATASTEHAIPQQGPAFLACQHALLVRGIDLDVVHLERDDLASFPVLIARSGPSMDPATQRKLADFHHAGGNLILIGDPPLLDDELRSCSILVDAGVKPYADLATVLNALPHVVAAAKLSAIAMTPADGGYAWLRTHPQRDVHYVIVVNRQAEQIRIEYALGGTHYILDVTLAPEGGALVRIERGQIAATVILDHNDTLGRGVVPACRLAYSRASVNARAATEASAEAPSLRHGIA